MSNELFSETLLDYINKTTARQWSVMDLSQKRHFSTASLDAALKELEDQLGRKSLIRVSHTTHESALGEWVASMTLAELQRRVNALVKAFTALPPDDPSWVYVKQAAGSSNDITFLGVYLYGLGIADGLYDEESGSP